MFEVIRTKKFVLDDDIAVTLSHIVDISGGRDLLDITYVAGGRYLQWREDRPVRISVLLARHHEYFERFKQERKLKREG